MSRGRRRGRSNRSNWEAVAPRSQEPAREAVASRSPAPPPSSAPPELGSHDGRAALLLDGAVQSVAVSADAEEPAGYWPALIPEHLPARTLLLGLGGGTVARLLLRRFGGEGALAITGVDDDQRVLELAQQAFGLDLPGLTVVKADAGRYLAECRQRGERFDLVVVDLFRDGAVPDAVCSHRFLGNTAAVLVPGGVLTINLNRGPRRIAQLRRLSRHFLPERLIGTGMNLVVHARPRPMRRYGRQWAMKRRLPRVTLYGRAGCHLCGDARALLDRLAPQLGFVVEEVDVDTDAELLALYDLVVPVVTMNGIEAARAPIDARDLEQRLRNLLVGG